MIVTEPRIMELIGRIQHRVEDAMRLNDPVVTTGAVGKASGKPESRPPGEQQCPWVAGEVERILARCADKLDAAYTAARVKAHAEHPTPSEDWREEAVGVDADDWEGTAHTLNVVRAKFVAKKRGAYKGPLARKLAAIGGDEG